MNESLLISIIIVNYNSGELLTDCVESIKRSKYKNMEIIVVDNASHDGSQKKCIDKFPNVNLIESKKNLGYCEGNNVGIKSAKGKFIVILNPDTTVDPNWIDELLTAFQQYGEGLYQPKLLSMSDKNIISNTGNMIHVFGFGFARDRGEIDKNKRNSIEHIGYASGTCLFTSVEVMEKIGFFDPFLFLYHDDLDLGWRAAKIGIKSYYVPKSIVYHVESYLLKWSAKKFFWLERNRQYCLRIHYSRRTYWKMWYSLAMVNLLVWVFYLSKGFVSSKIKADLDIIKNRKKIASRFLDLEEERIVTDTDLIKSYPDAIFVPENVFGSTSIKLFNSILKHLSKHAKKSILHK